MANTNKKIWGLVMWKRAKDRDRLKGCEFRNPGIRRKLIFLKQSLATHSITLHGKTTSWPDKMIKSEQKLCIEFCWAQDDRKNQNSPLSLLTQQQLVFFLHRRESFQKMAHPFTECNCVNSEKLQNIKFSILKVTLNYIHEYPHTGKGTSSGSCW